MILEFFKGLVRSRVTGVKVSAKGKLYGVQARARSKAASTFNKAVDGSVRRVKGRVKPGKKGSRQEKKKMGLFSFMKKKKRGGTQEMPVAEEEVVDEAVQKTQAIDLSRRPDAEFKPCVGWVVVTEGNQRGRDFRLVPGPNRVGTRADMDVVLHDPYVSSHHCTIVYTDDGIYQLSDAGSRNGTMVNGKKVMNAVIVDNDIIQVGRTVLRFKALD